MWLYGIEEFHRDVEWLATDIDQWVGKAISGQISGRQAEHAIEQLLHQFVTISVATADEVGLALEYARAAVDEVARLPSVMDLALIEHFEHSVDETFSSGVQSAHLELLLDPIVEACRHGDALAAERLTDLCSNGEESHPWLTGSSAGVQRILRTAHQLGCVPALLAAVDPRSPVGQLANHERQPGHFELALNQLGHLAADPDVERGRAAVVGLLELTEFLEIAAAAALRLPLQLLTDGDRVQLMNVLDARTAILETDPVFARPPLHLLRENRVIRGAVWQAHDAALLR